LPRVLFVFLAISILVSGGKTIPMFQELSDAVDKEEEIMITPSTRGPNDWPEWVIPWDASGDNAFNFSFLLDAPAGKHGFLNVNTSTGNYEFDDGTPVKFWGTCLWGNDCTPPKDKAPMIAERLARAGVNCVRWAMTANLPYTSADYRDRHDFFYYQLQQRGIYMVWLLSSSYNPEKMFEASWLTPQKAFDNFNHTNPYTGLQYKNDPSLVGVEITNEMAMFWQYLFGRLNWDSDPNAMGKVGPGAYLEYDGSIHADQVFSDWLINKYGTRANLKTAWSVGEHSLTGSDAVSNGGFESGVSATWSLVTSGGAVASISDETGSFTEGTQGAKVSITTSTGIINHVSLQQVSGISMQKGVNYTLSFDIKADNPEAITVYAGSGWINRYIWNTDWRRVNVTVVPTSTGYPNIKLYLGKFSGDIYIDNVSLRQGGPFGLLDHEDPMNGNVYRHMQFQLGDITLERYRDLMRFYIHRERNYYNTHITKIRSALGMTIPMTGTQSFCSIETYSLSDVGRMDSHEYWNYEDGHFTNTFGDKSKHNYAEQPIEFAMNQVKGMPLGISEHNVNWPNNLSHEVLPMTGAYASFQDLDHMFIFNYRQSTNTDWTDVDQFSPWNGLQVEANPVSMSLMPICAMMFIRGDVSVAETTINISYTQNETLDFIKNFGWGVGQPNLRGDFDGRYALEHRFQVEDYNASKQTSTSEVLANYGLSGDLDGQDIFISDTGELTMDNRVIGSERSEIFTLNTPRTQVITGKLKWNSGTARTLSTSDLEITSTTNTATIALSSRTWDDIRDSPELVMVTVARTGNTDMTWDNSGNMIDIGVAPIRVEPVETDVTISLSPNRRVLSVWALDPQGDRTVAVPFTTARPAGDLELSFSTGQHDTIWYEINTEEIWYDLNLTDLSHNRTGLKIFDGDTLTFTGNLTHSGSLGITSAQAIFTINGTLQDSKVVPVVENSTVEVSFDWTAITGTWDIGFDATGVAIVQERDMLNNATNLTLVVKPPPPPIPDIWVELSANRTACLISEEISFSARLHTTSTTQLPVVLNWSVDGNAWGVADAINVSQGTSIWINRSMNFSQAGIFNVSVLANGLYQINETNEDNNTTWVMIEVTEPGDPVNRPPIVNSTILDDISFPEDTIYTGLDLSKRFNDPDNDTLTFTDLGGVNITVEITGNGSVILTPLKDWSGKELLTFLANDSQFVASVEINVSVTPVNDPPTDQMITLLEKDYIEGSSQMIQGSASDVDIPYGDTLKFYWSFNTTETILMGEQVNLSLPAGWHNIELNVTDSNDEWVATSMELQVKRPDTPDDDIEPDDDLILPDDDDDDTNRTDDDDGISAMKVGVIVIAIIIILAAIIIAIVLLLIRKKEPDTEDGEVQATEQAEDLPPEEESFLPPAEEQPDPQYAPISEEGTSPLEEQQLETEEVPGTDDQVETGADEPGETGWFGVEETEE